MPSIDGTAGRDTTPSDRLVMELKAVIKDLFLSEEDGQE